MGQSVFRRGLSKVGLPGAKEGMQVEDPTIAGLLKDQGYATGQFGKNTSATATSTCRRTTGSMSSSGNLYHLNAEEEPENEDYPRHGLPTETFRRSSGPRGVIHVPLPDGDDRGHRRR